MGSDVVVGVEEGHCWVWLSLCRRRIVDFPNPAWAFMTQGLGTCLTRAFYGYEVTLNHFLLLKVLAIPMNACGADFLGRGLIFLTQAEDCMPKRCNDRIRSHAMGTSYWTQEF